MNSHLERILVIKRGEKGLKDTEEEDALVPSPLVLRVLVRSEAFTDPVQARRVDVDDVFRVQPADNSELSSTDHQAGGERLPKSNSMIASVGYRLQIQRERLQDSDSSSCIVLSIYSNSPPEGLDRRRRQRSRRCSYTYPPRAGSR